MSSSSDTTRITPFQRVNPSIAYTIFEEYASRLELFAEGQLKDIKSIRDILDSMPTDDDLVPLIELKLRELHEALNATDVILEQLSVILDTSDISI